MVVVQIKNKCDLEAEFERAGDKLVLVDFYATWCGPCRKIAPFVDQIAAEHQNDLVLLKVDVDEVEELVGEYAIEVMPTFVLRRNGSRLDKLVGSSEDKLRQLVAKHLS